MTVRHRLFVPRTPRVRPDYFRRESPRRALARLSDAAPLTLLASPEKLPRPGRQIEGGHVAGYVEQLQTKERHHAADDDPDEEHPGRDTQSRARGD